MNKRSVISSFLLCLLVTGFAMAQSGTLSNSPYSLYGLGQENYFGTGKINALGGAGLAIPSSDAINDLNPASFGTIPLQSFMFDIGLKGQLSRLQEYNYSNTKVNGGITNIALAFAVSKKSGIGLTLLPYTNVGYSISGIETSIEGSTGSFFTEVNGEGGLNELKLNYGHAFSEKLRIGVSGSFLFGSITETETNSINTSTLPYTLQIKEKTNYTGFRLSTGLQFDFLKNASLGVSAKLPVTLSGEQTRYIYQAQQNGDSIELFEESKADSFTLPLEIGTGVNIMIKEKFNLFLDYKKSLWGNTNQEDQLGTYVNKDALGFGIEYTTNKNTLNYWGKVLYRAGFRYDNGNLSVNNQRVSQYALTLGMGLPVGKRDKSMLNLTYAYGQEGQVSNGLIKENYHTLSLNISLEDMWFVKQKFN